MQKRNMRWVLAAIVGIAIVGGWAVWRSQSPPRHPPPTYADYDSSGVPATVETGMSLGKWVVSYYYLHGELPKKDTPIDFPSYRTRHIDYEWRIEPIKPGSDQAGDGDHRICLRGKYGDVWDDVADEPFFQVDQSLRWETREVIDPQTEDYEKPLDTQVNASHMLAELAVWERGAASLKGLKKDDDELTEWEALKSSKGMDFKRKSRGKTLWITTYVGERPLFRYWIQNGERRLRPDDLRKPRPPNKH